MASSPVVWTTRLSIAALVLAIALAGLFAFSPLSDFDTWWHLRTGQLILQEGRIPTTDPFSYTAEGRPWVSDDWLTEVVFYGFFRLGGADALVVLQTVLAGLGLSLAAAAALVGPGAVARIPATALGVLLAAPILAIRAVARPHMFTVAFLGLTLLLLRLDSFSRRKRWKLLFIPLFLVWANMHSGVLLGLLLIACYWAGEALSPRLKGMASTQPMAWRGRLTVFALSALVTLLTPNHVRLWLMPFEVISYPNMRDIIWELMPVFHPVYRSHLFLKALIASAGVLLILIFLERRRLPWSLLLPGAVFGFMGVQMMRSVTELSVLIPVLMGGLGARLGSRRALAGIVSIAVIAASIWAGICSIRQGIYISEFERPRPVGLGVYKPRFPVGAARFLKAVHPGGHLFNDLAFGGYLIHEIWPEQRVFIDGRLDVYLPDIFEQYLRISPAGEGWQAAMDRYGITIVAIPIPGRWEPDDRLLSALHSSPDWVCVFFGDLDIVFMHRTRGRPDIIDRFGISLDPTSESLQAIHAFVSTTPVAEVERTVNALHEMIRIAPDEAAPQRMLGLILSETRRYAEAVPWLRRAVEAIPGQTWMRSLLGNALFHAGALDEARRELLRVHSEWPMNLDALLTLADIERAGNRASEALAFLVKAEAIQPDHPIVLSRMGVLNAELGRLDQAERYLNRAKALRPDIPGIDSNLDLLRRMKESASRNADRN